MISPSGCGQIRSGWCKKERLGESFPTHQRMLDFVERIKSYDHLKLLVLGLTIFGDGFPTMSNFQISRIYFLDESC